MKNVRPSKVWAVSLIVIGVCTILTILFYIVGIPVPEAVKRIVGLINIIALPVLMYTTAKMLKDK